MTFKELENLYDVTDPEKIRTFIATVKRLRTSKEYTVFQLANDLGKISEEERLECRAVGLNGQGMSVDDRQRLTKAAVLTACCIILLCETRSKMEIRNKAMLLLEYLSYLQTGNHNLLEVAAKVCSYPMLDPGFTMSHLETPNCIDIIAYNLSQNAKFNIDDKLSPVSMDSAGSIIIKDGVISLSSTSSWETRVRSFTDHSGLLEVCTRNARDEKLKASEVDEVDSIENFARIFLLSQSDTARSRQSGRPKVLTCGKKYTVKLIPDKDDAGVPVLSCIPIYADCAERCRVKSEELVKGVHTEDLLEYVYDDDYLEDAVFLDENTQFCFSIKESYVNYVKTVANRDCADRRVYQAKVINFFKGKTDDKDRVILLSDKGYGGLMIDDHTLEKGQVIAVYTQNVIGSDNALFINMVRPTCNCTEVSGVFDEEDVLVDFITGKEDALRHVENADRDNDEVNNSKDIVWQIAAILSQSKEKRSVVRYRDILCSAFLFNIAGDDVRKNLALDFAEYLCQCLRFAEGINVRPLADNTSLSEREKKIVGMLASLGSTRDICKAVTVVQGMYGEKEQELAKLFMAHTLSCFNMDDFSASQENLRRKLCELLGVGDHFKGDVSKGGGKYGKGELENVEFKSSYVYYNKDGSADLFKQGRGQVLEAVCGFMNKNGGTVYVGVNDSGNPLVSENYGINADIAWFQSNFNAVSIKRRKQLGHSVPKPENLDSYCRFMNSELELYFKPTVRGCVSISPTEDMDAIRITVKPSEYEIAKLYTDNTWTEGCVYVRDGEESRPMTRHDQEQRLMKLRSVGKVEKFILTLTEAIDSKRKIVLKNYASGNSNVVKDRFVVPINLVYNDENLWAYDVEKKECREFRLSRIEDIIVEDSTYSHAYEKGEADIFRWVNPKLDYHIKLKMSISALNSLREEYSNAKNLPADELYQVSPERWILDTHLHGLGAVRRFYLGLADQIEILDTEDSENLKHDIREFIDKNLQ